MANDNRHKTPEELGEAVGKKIEELFGGMFADEAPEGLEPPSEKPQSEDRGMAARKETSGPAPQPTPVPAKKKPPAPPPGKTQRPRPSAPKQQAGTGFEDIVEQMEILILNLEWEVSPESVNGLIKKFKELERFYPVAGQARTILSMNRRGLQRFASPDAVPHPSLVKLLQDSITALRQIQSSKGRRPASDSLIAGLSSSFKEIMAAEPVGEPKRVDKRGVDEDDHRAYLTLVKNVGTTVHSLEEVSQRLSRILGVLRQGGEMSSEEITRRLGTLEHLLTERVGQMSTFHRELAKLPGVGDEGLRGASGDHDSVISPDGLLMLVWGGINLAVPSSSVVALYPLSRAQAQQFMDKPAISLGSRTIQRLPLKKPKAAAKAGRTIPTWLLHLSHPKKDYFLLADRSLGFRVPPKGTDISKQSRIKIGATSYAILNLANFR